MVKKPINRILTVISCKIEAVIREFSIKAILYVNKREENRRQQQDGR